MVLYLQCSGIQDTHDYLKNKLTQKLQTLFKNDKPEAKIKGLVQELIQKNKIVILIDAYDQTPSISFDVVNTFIKEVNNDIPLFLTTRPYNLEKLDMFTNSNEFKIAEMKPFGEKQLKQYYGGLLKKTTNISQKSYKLLNIPLLAKFVKYLILKDITVNINTKTELFQVIVSELIKKEKEILVQSRKVMTEYNFEEMESCLEEISLKSLRHEEKGYFLDRHVKDKRKFLSLFKEVEFIKYIVDYENILEKKHVYQHPNFQEFFTARRLCRLYQEEKKDLFLKSLKEIKFFPELSIFISELITLTSNDPGKDFDFWQDTLCTTKNDDMRTYALQVRDALGESRAKQSLTILFEEEQEMIDKKVSKLKETLASEEIPVPDNMVLVPGGKFIRGSYIFYWPVRWIELDSFLIDKNPVTNIEFVTFLKGFYSKNKKLYDDNNNLLFDFCRSKINKNMEIEGGYNQHPVVWVTWYGAKAYCEWRSEIENVECRLPTEAEWEKASRGLWGRIYAWGNEFDKNRCNTRESQSMFNMGTKEVYKNYSGISVFGCFDMTGNVFEWCKDKYYGEFYKNSPNKNPLNTDLGNDRIVNRGGAWSLYSNGCECAFRHAGSTNRGDGMTGFRCVRGLVRLDNTSSSYERARNERAEKEKKVERLMGKASISYDAQKYEEAISTYDEALKIKPDYHEAWYNKGDAFSELGRYQEAITAYNKALKIKSDHHEAWYNKGNALRELGRHAKAVAAYVEALKIKPNHHLALLSIENMINKLDSHEGAIAAEAWYCIGDNQAKFPSPHIDPIAAFDKALKIKSGHYEAWYSKGKSLAALGRYADAIGAFDKTLKIKSGHHNAWFSKGNALGALKRHEEEIVAFEQALKIKDSPYAWYNMGNTFGKLGRHVESITAFDEALKKIPDDPYAWYGKGLSHYNLGNYEEAIEALNEALKIKPDYHEARNAKAIALQNLDRDITHQLYIFDLLSDEEKQVERDAQGVLTTEDEQIAKVLSYLLCHRGDVDLTLNEIQSEIRRIGQQLYSNGGTSRMKVVAYRANALGGDLRTLQICWAGVCSR